MLRKALFGIGVLVLSAGLFAVYSWKVNLTIARCLLTGGRLVTNRVSGSVFVDDIERPDAKLFRPETGELLIYFSDDEVWVVNDNIVDVGRTFGDGRFDLVFGRLLFQSDLGRNYAFARSHKWEINPRLVIDGSNISFEVPSDREGRIVHYRIELQN